MFCFEQREREQGFEEEVICRGSGGRVIDNTHVDIVEDGHLILNRLGKELVGVYREERLMVLFHRMMREKLHRGSLTTKRAYLHAKEIAQPQSKCKIHSVGWMACWTGTVLCSVWCTSYRYQ
jgi:hypothetical protein